ncbi:hypothetical protein OO015_03760 [Thermomicrobium sp. 4228-Ro]|uniref:hypothetical protein n=1 Tax=Thermomicrobium sp. 4228-Ro TaxID=2993937 RepID=UPI0022488AAF|nr:hypothetical protein [Thermomicrobium sp. 4228-Ro]MCX2726608.1 hypothetical protein [Thermomicrobium sp. 4228-Ro]
MPATATPIPHPTGPHDLVLRIETSGGLIPPFRLLNELPQFSVYGDGTIVTLGPQIMIYPPPVLPNLLQSRISEEGLQILLQEAAAAGLLAGDADFPLEGVADAPTTFFTVNAGSRKTRVTVYALGIEEPDDPRLSPELREARRKLAEFATKAQDFLSWLPPETILERETPYPITRLQLILFPVDAPEAPPPAEEQLVTTRPWPLATPLASLGAPAPWAGTNARCAVIADRNELPVVLDALRTANLLTQWESDGERFSLVVRPLLPDETGCTPKRW